MPLIATLPMYDWPEARSETDARWSALRDALRGEGFDAPNVLTRPEDPTAVWLSPDLLIGETCSHPLATILHDRVRYLATPVHQAEGCGAGTYRSVIVRRGPGGHVAAPSGGGPLIDPDILSGRLAANEPGSMSGYVALRRDMTAAGLGPPSTDAVLWTGSHRGSIRAVAGGEADHAAIDCVTWQLARRFEPASGQVHVAGWTAARPGLPLITSLTFDEEEVSRIRRAVLRAMDVVVLKRPTEPEPG